MHQAVRNNNLELVKLLDSLYGDAKIKNKNFVSAIDLVVDEDKEYRDLMRELRHYFKAQPKYRDIDFSHSDQ